MMKKLVELEIAAKSTALEAAFDAAKAAALEAAFDAAEAAAGRSKGECRICGTDYQCCCHTCGDEIFLKHSFSLH